MSNISFSNIGFDFGIKPNYMLIPNIEYNDLISKARFGGVCYIFTQPDMTPVHIAFVFENEKYAEKLFDIFLDWIKKSDNIGDAIAMNFIENNDGSYTLALAPQIDYLIKRMLPKELNNKVNPMVIATTYYKKLDSITHNYLQFKDKWSNANQITVGYIIGKGNDIRKCSKKYFIKKEFHFYKEGDQSAEIAGHNARIGLSELEIKNLPRLPRESKTEIISHREKMMNELLPLTVNKLDNLWLKDVINELSKEYDLQIIKQSICNIVIFERLKRENIISDLTEQDYSARILEHLVFCYESFESYYPKDDFFSKEIIIKQIQNDKKVLEKYITD